MTIRIDKFVLYILVLILLLIVLCGQRIYAYLSYERAEGRVTGYERTWVHTRSGGYYKSFPIVEFDTRDYHVAFTAPSYMKDIAGVGKNFTVIYNRNNPEVAYVMNFYGLWGQAAIFLIPFFLIWTIVILRPDIIPRKVILEI